MPCRCNVDRQLVVCTAFISTYRNRSTLYSSGFSKKSLGFTAQHAIVVSIVKQHSHYSSKEEIVTIIEDNRKEPGHVQKGDGYEAKKLQTCELIFQLFLDISSKM